MRRALALVLPFLLWSTGALAATPLPLELPPPELPSLIPLVAPPLDKPPVTLAEPPLPVPPEVIPPLPSAPLMVDLSEKPIASLPAPGLFPCNPLGTFFSVAKLLECGQVRFQRDELEAARSVLEEATRVGSDRDLVAEARYWLGETLIRLNRVEEAERAFRLVSQHRPWSELGIHAVDSLGWIALRLNDPGRALENFEQIKASTVPQIIPSARHGRALALYALGRYAEAREAWRSLAAMGSPAPPGREVSFWLGETFGQLGEYAEAVEHLRRFTQGGRHRLLEAGILRLGWREMAAGRHLESVKTFRWLLAAYPRSQERGWARVGLALALLALDDFPAALDEARQLQLTDAAHSLVVPTLLHLLRASVEKAKVAPARAILQELLALNLSAASRSYALLLHGEISLGDGQSGEARSQFELARSVLPGTPLAWRATLRLIQMDLEAREYTRALDESGALLGQSQSLSPELRAAALVLRGEAGYWTRDYNAAVGALERFLNEFPGHPQTGAATMSLGWAEFRRGNLKAARERWIAVARTLSGDERGAQAFLLAADLAGRAGDLAGAGGLLDQMLARYPAHALRDVALVNRVTLWLRAGRWAEAEARFGEVMSGVQLSPFLGRARLTHGAALLALGRAREAVQEFQAALQQGEGVLAHLGLGSALLAQLRWNEAAQHFTDARDSGTDPVREAALYGLAVTAYLEGKRQEFSQQAMALLKEAPNLSATPRLLYVLSALSVEDKAWPSARTLTMRLVSEYPGSEEADDSLFRLGSGAGAAAQWGLAREAWELLLARYPESLFQHDARLRLGEALFRLGVVTEARKLLEAVVAQIPGDSRLPQALLLLGQSREATGDRAGAIEIYSRAAREFPDVDVATAARLGQGRLLQQAGRWEEARRLLEAVLAADDQAASVEAAYRLGEGYRSRGAHEAAVEAYMTAAYLAPDTHWGRRALLGAGQSFAALKQTEAAAIVYRKLLAQPEVELELAGEARKALQRLGKLPDAARGN